MEALFHTPEWEPVLCALLGDDKDGLENVIDNDSFADVEDTVHKLVTCKCREGRAISRERDGYVEMGDDVLRDILEYLEGAFQVSLANAATDVESGDEAIDLIAYTLYTAALLLETMRTPLGWQDLTDRERGILEPAVMDYLRRRHSKWNPITRGILPLDGEPVEFAFRFVILWSRTNGKIPAWARDFIQDDETSADN